MMDVAAVLPGAAIAVAVLLSQMERDSSEYIIDPRVVDRHTLVAVAGRPLSPLPT